MLNLFHQRQTQRDYLYLQLLNSDSLVYVLLFDNHSLTHRVAIKKKEAEAPF